MTRIDAFEIDPSLASAPTAIVLDRMEPDSLPALIHNVTVLAKLAGNMVNACVQLRYGTDLRIPDYLEGLLPQATAHMPGTLDSLGGGGDGEENGGPWPFPDTESTQKSNVILETNPTAPEPSSGTQPATSEPASESWSLAGVAEGALCLAAVGGVSLLAVRSINRIREQRQTRRMEEQESREEDDEGWLLDMFTERRSPTKNTLLASAKRH